MSKTPAQLDSEIAVARMIGRHVKSGWHGLADGMIVQWEPFGAGMTDVLVRDVASGRDAWYASHGLSPIDGKGPLPSRTDVKKLRQREMEVALETIRAQHVKEFHRPWPGAEHGKAIVGRSIDAALADVRGRRHSTIRALSSTQLEALRAFAKANGRSWKSKLNVAWSTGRYADYNGTDDYGSLQQIRNSFGPAWLARFSFDR